MVSVKKPEEIEMIAKSGRILSSVMKELSSNVSVGITLKSLDNLAYKLIVRSGAKPAFLNYTPSGAGKPYKFSLCTSVNDVIVHGTPSNYRLKSEDLLKLDLGVIYKGFYSDAAVTVSVGEPSNQARKLIEATKEALYSAIKVSRPGYSLGDIGFEIETCAKRFSLKFIKNLTGHGVGYKLHEEPSVYNYGKRGQGLKLKAGMVLAIEPMLAVGTDKIIQKNDESWATEDGSLSAHFEHTVAITEKEPRILTE